MCVCVCVCAESSKQCALPVIATVALWQLMQLSTSVHHAPKSMSDNRVITGRVHCFDDYIHITPILLL